MLRRVIPCSLVLTRSCSTSTSTFRNEFQLPSSFDLRAWFPMHMSVQMKKMEGKLRSVDLIVEVHDARVPITGRNPTFYQQLYAVRPHILVMNKMDLINLKKYKLPIEQYYHERGVKHIVWTDCKRRLQQAMQDVQKILIDSLRSDHRYNRAVKTEYLVMVVGIPNVGKSSLINSLRTSNLGIQQKAVAEGARPGVTIRVQNRVRILDRPPVYIVDTPGILAPHGQNVDDAMKLSLCNLILQSATNPYYVADYLLYWLNRTGDFSYVDLLRIRDGPTDDIQKLLLSICQNRNLHVQRVMSGLGPQTRWDIDTAVSIFIDMYRSGKFADQCLDKQLLEIQ